MYSSFLALLCCFICACEDEKNETLNLPHIQSALRSIATDGCSFERELSYEQKIDGQWKFTELSRDRVWWRDGVISRKFVDLYPSDDTECIIGEVWPIETGKLLSATVEKAMNFNGKDKIDFSALPPFEKSFLNIETVQLSLQERKGNTGEMFFLTGNIPGICKFDKLIEIANEIRTKVNDGVFEVDLTCKHGRFVFQFDWPKDYRIISVSYTQNGDNVDGDEKTLSSSGYKALNSTLKVNWEQESSPILTHAIKHEYSNGSAAEYRIISRLSKFVLGGEELTTALNRKPNLKNGSKILPIGASQIGLEWQDGKIVKTIDSRFESNLNSMLDDIEKTTEQPASFLSPVNLMLLVIVACFAIFLLRKFG